MKKKIVKLYRGESGTQKGSDNESGRWPGSKQGRGLVVEGRRSMRIRNGDGGEATEINLGGQQKAIRMKFQRSQFGGNREESAGMVSQKMPSTTSTLPGYAPTEKPVDYD